MAVDAKEKKQKFTQWVQSLENETNEDPDDFETMESDGKKRKNIRITIFILILLAVIVLAVIAWVIYGRIQGGVSFSESAADIQTGEKVSSQKAVAERAETSTQPAETEVGEPAPQTAVSIPEEASLAPARSQGTAISFTVPAEYSFDGKTEYMLTPQEYEQLLSDLHRYIEQEVTGYTKQIDPFFPHFENIKVNEDCTVYTVTVNDGITRTPYELELPDHLAKYSKMYAVYSQQGVEKVTIEYRALTGDLSSKESFST